jgi:nucleoside-diphosphate kinase
MEKAQMEQTLVLIKPDAIKNSLTGYILSQLSEYHTNSIIAGAKIVTVSKELASEHYAEHRTKSFFPDLLEYINGTQHFPNEPQKRRIKAFVYQGQDIIKKVREIAGPTNPNVARNSKPGCIRSLGTVFTLTDENGKKTGDIIDNLIHASANPEDAEREIKLWFKPAEMPKLLRAFETEKSTEMYFYKEGKIALNYTPGSFCLIAPGDMVWKSDLEALQSHLKGQPAKNSIEAVAAKYLINVD